MKLSCLLRCLVIILLLAPVSLSAQHFTISGRLTDSQQNPLPNATLLLLNPSDSTMVNYGLSNAEGYFEIRQVRRSPWLLRMTYVGYTSRYLEITPPRDNLLALGTLQLEEARTMLQEVTIQEERIPMRIKGDTIEYDARAFTVQPNAVVEELLRRMPGIEIESDGNIIAQGEQVRRVLVDGREFFGRDPRMATQNLPADAIERVHVFDERSEQARFSGIDDGQRERTMNLELKEDRKEGMFGTSSLGYGPDNRFQGRANLNRFDSRGQLSLLAMGNNINQQGFSIAEYMNFSGATQAIMSGAGGQGRGGGIGQSAGASGIAISDGMTGTNGIMTSVAGGLNMNRKISGKTDLTASYFINHLNHDLNRDLDRENFLPSGNYFFRQNSIQDNLNRNHRLNLRLDHRFTDQTSLLFTTAASLTSSRSELENASLNITAEGQLQNTSDQISFTEGGNQNLQSSILLRHRFAKAGRTISLGMDLTAAGSDQEGSLEALNRFMGQDPREERLLQDNLQDNRSQNLAASMNYTEPLGNRRFIEFNYRVIRNTNDVDQSVFDLFTDSLTGQIIHIPNPALSNQYNNLYLYHRAGINLRINRDDWSMTLGGSYQTSTLNGEVRGEAVSERSYYHLLPVFRVNYQFSTFRRIMLDAETSVQEPGILQMQPLIDNRDPLNIYVGNPELQPAYRYRVNLRFHSFNPVSSFGYFAFISAEYSDRPITNSVFVTEDLIRIISPVNTDQSINLRANLNTNFQIPALKSRIMLGTTLSRNQTTDILNLQEQKITNNILSGNLRYNFRPGDSFEALLSAQVNQQLTDYQFGSLEQAYLNQTYGTELNWNFLKHYRLTTGFRYQIFRGQTAAFDREIPMLDAGFSRTFLRNNSGELKLSAYNLLNQDLGVIQRVDVNYLEQQITNSLGRYFLLSFTYSLNRGLNVMEGVTGGPGRMRMGLH